MAYRFSDTLKWSDEWFIDLKTLEKLFFMYLCDNCDIAGFFEISIRKITFDLNISEEEILGAIKGLDRGLILSNDGKILLVKNFIKHQKNLPLNIKNNAHNGIINRFKLYKSKFIGLTLNEEKGFIKLGANKPLDRGTDKDKGNYTIDILLVKEILNFFNFTETANYDKMRIVGKLHECLTLNNRIEYFTNQFKSYAELKKINPQYIHSFKNFIGTQENLFEDGAWNLENWTAKLSEHKKSLTQAIKPSEQRKVWN